MQDQSQKTDMVKDMKGVLGIVAFGIHAWAATHREAFTWPGSAGFRFFGKQAVVGLFLPFLTLLLWGERVKGGEYLIWYFWFLVGMLLIHRIATSIQLARGVKIHSHYVGDSVFERLFPRFKETTTKGGMELLAAVSIGVLLCYACEPLGFFIMGGGFANIVSLSLIGSRDDRVVEEAIDQEIMGRYHAERIRKKMGEDS